MIVANILTPLLFFSYYFSCQNYISKSTKILFSFAFIVISILLRGLISPSLNKDYVGYFDLYNFEKTDSIFSFFFSEPYLSILFNCTKMFSSDKFIIINFIYWINLIFCVCFFVWLSFRKDIILWKKMVIFVFYYFLTGYVVLRNAPVYYIYSFFFYYSYRDIKYYKTIFTPLMHLSSIPLLILLLHNKKRYFHYLTFAFLVSLPIFLIVILPIMGNIEALQNSLDKADTYADGMSEVGVFHKLFLMFIIFILFLTFWVYQRQMVHPIIITTFLIYFIAYFINPVMGFRFSPYVILSVLLSNFDSKYKFGNLTKVLNILIIILIPYFIFTFYDTHFI